MKRMMLQEFNNEKEARASPLAAKLFEIPEVSSVLLGDKYLCVTRRVGPMSRVSP